ncbi:MAG: alpha/beta fold hydrolase [bacterium]
MKSYLLVHGAWHGAWAWDETRNALEAAGHKVETLDLPGHGQDTTDVKDVTFRGYVDAVKAKLSRSAGPQILVGHSLGGVVVSQVAEEMPQSVEALVFVSGFVLRADESLFDVMSADTGVTFLPKLVFTEDQSAATVSMETLASMVYNGGSEAQVAKAAPLLRPQATQPFFAHTTLSDANFGPIRKLYVECDDDRVLSLDMQRTIEGRFGITPLATLHCGHVPLVTASRALGEALARA